MKPTAPGLKPPADPLAGLKDIHLPPTPSWWPPALGWWLVALLVLGAGLALFLIRRRQREQERPVRLALQELTRITPPENGENADTIRDFLKQLSTLLRRFCLVRFPGKRVADLYGDEWVDFLVAAAPEAEREFFRRELAPLAKLYAPDREVAELGLEANQLLTAVRRWLEGQKKRPPASKKKERETR